ncbi:hypothetical protein JW824_05045 [bacterium]|nr:hypothetical protein [bacterium]
MKKTIICIHLIFLLLYFFSPGYGHKPSQDIEPEVSLVIVPDETLMEEENDRSAAWLGYLLARVGWLQENVNLDRIDVTSYQISFDEEAYAREAMAEIWNELKMDNPENTDRYLDELVLIDENNFIREYIWIYLRKEHWEKMPDDLKLQEFLKWLSETLPEHKIETLGDLYLEKK